MPVHTDEHRDDLFKDEQGINIFHQNFGKTKIILGIDIHSDSSPFCKIPDVVLTQKGVTIPAQAVIAHPALLYHAFRFKLKGVRIGQYPTKWVK